MYGLYNRNGRNYGIFAEELKTFYAALLLCLFDHITCGVLFGGSIYYSKKNFIANSIIY